MAISINTGVSCTRLKKQLLKINFVMSENMAILSSKYDVNPWRYDLSYQADSKMRTDRRTDSFSALYSSFAHMCIYIHYFILFLYACMYINTG